MYIYINIYTYIKHKQINRYLIFNKYIYIEREREKNILNEPNTFNI